MSAAARQAAVPSATVADGAMRPISGSRCGARRRAAGPLALFSAELQVRLADERPLHRLAAAAHCVGDLRRDVHACRVYRISATSTRRPHQQHLIIPSLSATPLPRLPLTAQVNATGIALIFLNGRIGEMIL